MERNPENSKISSKFEPAVFCVVDVFVDNLVVLRESYAEATVVVAVDVVKNILY